jgi:hypothetical protein
MNRASTRSSSLDPPAPDWLSLPPNACDGCPRRRHDRAGCPHGALIARPVNGATRAALAFAIEGFPAREMLGGVEYWIREGFPVRTADRDVTGPADPLTAPVCGC